jgi:hypothetical protein
MDDRLPPTPGPGTELALRGNLLGPVIRRDIADLNRQFLELSLDPSMGDDPRFCHAVAVRAGLAGCSAEARERMALCPFSLFQLRLPEPAGTAPLAADRVADARMPQQPEIATAARCQSFVLLSLSVARQLADGVPLSPRIALGVTAQVETRLAAMSPSELACMAAWSGLVRPRWPRHDRYWGMLIAAAREADPAWLQWTHCVGLCLPAAATATADTAAVPAVRRRGRFTRGGPVPGVPC